MKMKRILFLSIAVFVIGIIGFSFFHHQRSGKYVPKTFVKGHDHHFVSFGYADDGDEKTTGKLKKFRSPETLSRDGNSSAFSSYINYKTLRGDVVAMTNAASEKTASSFIDSKVISSFVVVNTETCRYLIKNKVLSILSKGVGSYRIIVNILDSAKKEVPGTNYEFYYFFHKSKKNRIDVISRDNKTKRIEEDETLELEDIVSQEFILEPGEYVLKFRVQLNVQAKKSATLKTDAIIDLI